MLILQAGSERFQLYCLSLYVAESCLGGCCGVDRCSPIDEIGDRGKIAQHKPHAMTGAWGWYCHQSAQRRKCNAGDLVLQLLAMNQKLFLTLTQGCSLLICVDISEARATNCK